MSEVWKLLIGRHRSLEIQKAFSWLPETIKASLQVTFDADTLKVKVISPISVIKDKKLRFQLHC